jgi:hypothetical protein
MSSPRTRRTRCTTIICKDIVRQSLAFSLFLVMTMTKQKDNLQKMIYFESNLPRSKVENSAISRDAASYFYIFFSFKLGIIRRIEKMGFAGGISTVVRVQFQYNLPTCFSASISSSLGMNCKFFGFCCRWADSKFR